jgi:hypothetical protein
MRHAVAYGIGLALFVLGASGKSNDKPESLTIVFQFDGLHSEKSLREMQRELGSIMQDSRIQIDWRERDQVTASDWFPNLVVVKFKGRCRLEPVSDFFGAPSPLAFTYSTGGSVLPFTEIECDRVRFSLRAAMWGGDYGRSDELLGRALARVLAHELYHILGDTKLHADKGIAQRALSGSRLIADQLQFGEAELERMHSASGH